MGEVGTHAEAVVQTFRDDVDDDACIRVACWGNIVVFHTDNLVGRYAFQVDVGGADTVEQQRYGLAVASLDVVADRVDFEVLNILQQVAYVACHAYLLVGKGMYRLVNIMEDVLTFHDNAVDKVFLRLQLYDAHVFRVAGAILFLVAHARDGDDDF